MSIDRCLDENTLVEFAEGVCRPEATALVERHIDECAECRSLLHALAGSDSDPASEEPIRARLGRYRIDGWLGAGSFGVVYAAFDLELERAVALKLLRPEVGTPGASARLQREARILARLDHPNVVAIYDVGVHEERVFVVTRKIDGPTLRTWLRRESPGWEAIVRRFAEAGEGLAHAHAAGVIHADFKPDNVLIDTSHGEGRAVVTDFGLARQQSGPEPLETHDSAGSSVGGTPAYLAPERLAGGGATVLSDQFAFCVSLREALARVPAVPSWVHAILDRGTAPEPSARFASMRAVVDALAGPASHRGRWGGLAIVAAAGAVAVAALGVWPTNRDAVADACDEVDAAMTSAWSEERESTLRAELEGAGTRWDEARPSIDTYVEQWRVQLAATCEQGRGDAGSAWRRLGCLEGAFEQLDQLLISLPRSKALTSLGIHGALASLPLPADCSASDGFEPLHVDDPEHRRRWFDAAGELGRARALHTVGDRAEALAVIEASKVAVAELDDAALSADHSLLHADIAREADDLALARDLGDGAIVAAERARADPLRARGHLLLAAISARAGNPEDARRELERAVAIAERLVGHEILQAQIQMALGHRIAETWRPADAQPHFERALEIYRRHRHPDRLVALYSIGSTLRRQHLEPEALPKFEEAHRLAIAQFGSEHPMVGRVLLSVAMTRLELGEPHGQRARDELRRAVGLLEAGFGAASPDVLSARQAVGNVALADGDYATAADQYERCTRAAAEAFPDGHPFEGYCRHGLGRVELARGAPGAAAAALDPAYRMMQRFLDPGSEAMAEIAFELGRALYGIDPASQRSAALFVEARQGFERNRNVVRMRELDEWRASNPLRPDAPAP